MEYICIPSQLESGTFESGIPLCCEQCISSCGQEAAQSFLSRSFPSKHSSHMIWAQMQCAAQVCGWRPLQFALLCQKNPKNPSQWTLVEMDLGPPEEKVHLPCLILLDFSPVLQCWESSKVGLQGWWAQTCHKLSNYQAQAFAVQADYCFSGRSRRGQVQKEEDSPPCLDKPARLTIRVLWFLFLIVRRVPRPSESGCKKCNGLKKYLLGHTFSWKRLSAILCPWNPPWWWFFSLKLNKKCLKTPSKIKGLSFISSNLGNMDFFLIFNCISH